MNDESGKPRPSFVHHSSFIIHRSGASPSLAALATARRHVQLPFSIFSPSGMLNKVGNMFAIDFEPLRFFLTSTVGRLVWNNLAGWPNSLPNHSFRLGCHLIKPSPRGLKPTTCDPGQRTASRSIQRRVDHGANPRERRGELREIPG